MPYSIDTSTKFISVIYSGMLNIRDIEGVLKDTLAMHNNKLTLFTHIEDMRKLEGINLGFSDLMTFSENIRTLKLPQTTKTAILTGNGLQYGIARMFQTILQHPQMNIKVFSKEEEALTWLSESQ